MESITTESHLFQTSQLVFEEHTHASITPDLNAPDKQRLKWSPPQTTLTMPRTPNCLPRTFAAIGSLQR